MNPSRRNNSINTLSINIPESGIAQHNASFCRYVHPDLGEKGVGADCVDIRKYSVYILRFIPS
jgi:hypothetical protein